MTLFGKLRSFWRKGWLDDRDHGGQISVGWPWNYWQSGLKANSDKNEIVYACVQAYAWAIAQLPGRHIRTNETGYDEDVQDSPLYNVMSKPNVYQTRSDLLLNTVSSLLYDGNAYLVGLRDARFQIRELHLIPPHAAKPVVTQGEVFYHISPDPVSRMNSDMLVPAREVAHIRLNTPIDPLRGESPIYAASLAVETNNNIGNHQSRFFENMTRPSGVLETDEKLNPEEIGILRERWEEQSKCLNSGGVPILSWGIKWKPLALSSIDAQLIEAQKMSVKRIASVYKVPLPIIGVLDDATFNNVQNLILFWKSTGLGFVLEHIEQNIAALFDLPQNDRMELDTDRLMRSDMVARIEALTKGITGGLYAPNEGRRGEGLPPAEGGDVPRVQQQMVPLNWAPPVEPRPSISRSAFVRAVNKKLCQPNS